MPTITDTPTPCYGQHDLFDSPDLQDHLAAKAICDTCPLIESCALELAATIAASHNGGRPEGTWAGQHLVSGRVRRSDRRVPSRVAQDDAKYTDAEAKYAYSVYRTGRTDEWARVGSRVWAARLTRAQRAERANLKNQEKAA
ncbi:MAG: hypothetical protein JWP74_1732 [Marmoricola sp.]|nr:hypothetical protein [Marmoricola sp.]